MITAVWPAESLTDITRNKQVGRITKFIKHTVKVVTHVKPFTEEKHHMFCSIDWYVKHLKEDWYGCSAIVCNNFTYSENNCSFMVIQRILDRCAFGIIKTTIPPRHSEETLFIAIPVPLKH